MTQPRRPPNPALQALADFFESSDAEQGMRSSFGPLADMARAGFGSGSADHERAYTDRRFGLGPAGSGAVTRARATRSALATLDPQHVAILFARYGGTPWHRIIERAFSHEKANHVTQALGDLAGVALLAPSVAKGHAAASAKHPPPARWDNPGGYIVALCSDGKRAGTAARVGAECRALLAAAELAYLDAVGAAPTPGPRRQTRPARLATEPEEAMS